MIDGFPVLGSQDELPLGTPGLGTGIAGRYLRYVLGALMLVLLVFSSLAVWRQFSQERADLAAAAESHASFLSAVTPESVFFRDYLTLETLVRTTTSDHDTLYAVVIDADGRSMTRFLDRNNPQISAAIAQVESPDAQRIADLVAADALVREVRQPIVSEGVMLGEVRLGYSTQVARDRAIAFATQALIATLVLALLLTALTALVFEWQIGRPLQQLLRGANALAAGDLSRRVPVMRNDEIGTVHQAFNVMAGELEQTMAAAHEAKVLAENAARVKTEFLANMSHEIRTPLNAVLGLTEVVLGTPLTPDQHNLLETVHRSGSSLLEIINDILYLSKIEAGRLDLEVEPFDLRRTVDEVANLFDLEAERKELCLTTDIAPEVGRDVVGDPARLRQVLVNLVGNAIKFTEQGSVTVEVLRPGNSTSMPGVEFRVRDTGVGIDEQRLPQVFAPFTQADASTTRTHGGTGLGLTIAKRLVDLMGGELVVTSTPGIGSTFMFSVPLARSETAAHVDGRVLTTADAASSGSTSPSALTVLVAEDDAVNRLVALQMLSRLGYEADVAHDGLEAVEMATRGSYDVILMDVQMPHLDGVAAMRQIRDTLPTPKHPRIVALTANAVEGDRERYLADGMDAYLSKPIRLRELRAALESRACDLAEDLCSK